MRWHTAVLIVLITGMACPTSATPEHIGSWILECSINGSNAETCQLRAIKRLVDKGGITGDLEVAAQGKRLVPVLALRGLSPEILMAAALAGKVEASMQFPGIAPQPLDCAISNGGYFCAPGDSAAQILAARLPTAQSATVRLSVTISGLNPLPEQERSVNLSGTSEALARLRSVAGRPLRGPAAPGTAMPEPRTPASRQPGQDAAALPRISPGVLAMADKALKSAGYKDGVAGLWDMLATYLRK